MDKKRNMDTPRRSKKSTGDDGVRSATVRARMEKREAEERLAEEKRKEELRAKRAAEAKTEKRRPAPAKKKRKKKKSHLLRNLLLILLLLILIAGGVYYLDISGIYKTGVSDLVPIDFLKPAATKVPYVHTEFSSLYDEDPDLNNDGLNSKDGNSITVSNLSITEGLNPDWLNVLLLGADARNASEPCRTDTMMICSVNTKTGEVKLTSIMRDTCVSLPGHPSTRINSAYFYGGAKLALKTVNEYFGMNIDKYVFVDFNGFANIAESLGGIEIDITQNEMNMINRGVYEQYHVLINQGKMEYDAAAEEYYATELKTFGSDIHLNGMQTLGYARIRKIDSDYARTERQRKVLNLMLSKLKGADLNRIMTLVYGNVNYFQTNLSINDIVTIASTVLSNPNFSEAGEMRLPVNGSYKEEKRGNDAMLYDMDKTLNTRELHAFIYG